MPVRARQLGRAEPLLYYSQRLSVILVKGQDRAAHNLLSSILRDDCNIDKDSKKKGNKKRSSPKKKKSDE
jgi:hypothetical protein